MIETNNLMLKPIENYHHFNDVNRILNDGSTKVTTDIKSIIDFNCDSLIKSSEKSFSLNGYGLYLVMNKSMDTVHGITGLLNTSEQNEQYLFFCFTNESDESNIAMEAATNILSNATVKLKASNLIGSCTLENDSSNKIFKGLGFNEMLQVNYFSKSVVYYHMLLN
jgi:hypothetical protein